MSRQRPVYGPNWRAMNKLVRAHRHLLRCEHCQEAPVTLHHMVPQWWRPRALEQADMPHFWILLCGTCHWYASRCPSQSFQRERLAKLREEVFGFNVMHAGPKRPKGASDAAT